MDDSKGMLGGAGHSALEGGEVGGDAINMEVNKGVSIRRSTTVSLP